jgi:hypothetical protein
MRMLSAHERQLYHRNFGLCIKIWNYTYVDGISNGHACEY